MDFEVHYTAEQQAFREEVRSWIKSNTSPDMKPPIDPEKLTKEQHAYFRSLRNKLGEKGWLTPLYPKEYGGGGLSKEEAIIVAEELADEVVPNLGDLGQSLIAPAIMVNGTEEQRKRFLPPILRGEVLTWQTFTEPDAGTDLASLRARAERDGDDFILNGQKIFIGAAYDVDFLYTLAITDPSKPRHNNIGAFLIPANTPGVAIQPMSIIAGGTKNAIYFDNVRVPSSQLIGGITDGWRIAQSTLEVEHGGSGSPVQRDRFVERLFEYCREAKRNGQPISKDSAARNTLVDIWMSSQVLRLFELRNYWMRVARVQWAWEGSQNALYRKNRMPKVAGQVLSVLGPYALTDDPKVRPLLGEFEVQQRGSLLTHPGGTPEAQKIVMARRIGISKTRQTAAAIV